MGNNNLDIKSKILDVESQIQSSNIFVENETNDYLNESILLDDNEKRYKYIVENSTSIVLEWDTNGNIVFLNQFGLDLFGFKKEEIFGRNVVGTIVEPIDSEGYDLAQKMKIVPNKPEEFYSSENENVKKNGKKLWIAWTNRGIFDSEGNLIKTLSIGIDRTKQRELEKQMQKYQLHLEDMIKSRTEELSLANQQLMKEIEERKFEKNELFEKKSLLKSILDNMQDAFFRADINGKFTFVNKTAYTMYGYDKDDNLEDMMAVNLYAHDYDRLELIEELKQKGKVNDKTLLAKRKDGSVFWVSMNVQFVYDINGTIIGTEGISRDITDRVYDEEIIKNNEARLESLLRINQYDAENINDLLDYTLNEIIELTKSQIGYIYFYNENNNEFTLNSWSKEVMDQCRVIEPQTKYQLDKTGLWGEAVRQRKPILVNDFLAHHPHKKGYPEGHVTLKRFLTIPVFYNENIVAVVGVGNKSTDYDNTDIRQLTLMMDAVWKITENKKNELALQEQNQLLEQQYEEYMQLNEVLRIANYDLEIQKEKTEESEIRFKSISEQALDGIVLTDLYGNYSFVNNAFCKIIGYTQDELLKMCVYDLKVPHDCEESFNKVLNNKSGLILRKPLLCKDKSIVYVDINSKVIEINGESFVLGIVRDITNQIKIEQELIYAKERAEESDKLKSAFLQNMSHEIRTPLNGIIGFSSLLVGQNDLDDEEKREYKLMIKRSSKRLQSMIDNIIEVSKITTNQINIDINEFSLLELFNEVIEQIQPYVNDKNLELIVDLDDRVQITIFSDQRKLELILNNLLNNAVKFTHNGKITLGFDSKINYYQFYVKDTGIGIDKSNYNKIFENFYQVDSSISRHFEGAGMGLSICKGLVEILGGEISVESELGKGSTFYLSIPKPITK